MELAERSPDFSLQVSLHAPTDELRTRIIPTNRTHPLAELLDAAHHYADASGQLVQLNYCLMRDFNDSLEQAANLADIVLGRPFLVKLVNFNPHDSLEFQPTTDERLSEFLEFLRQRGVNAISRPQLGKLEGAGCGQLDADYASQELRRAARA
jgi:23S rRNA (adenine2503-C2)-methyltransferase